MIIPTFKEFIDEERKEGNFFNTIWFLIPEGEAFGKQHIEYMEKNYKIKWSAKDARISNNYKTLAEWLKEIKKWHSGRYHTLLYFDKSSNKFIDIEDLDRKYIDNNPTKYSDASYNLEDVRSKTYF